MGEGHWGGHIFHWGAAPPPPPPPVEPPLDSAPSMSCSQKYSPIYRLFTAAPLWHESRCHPRRLQKHKITKFAKTKSNTTFGEKQQMRRKCARVSAANSSYTCHAMNSIMRLVIEQKQKPQPRSQEVHSETVS